MSLAAGFAGLPHAIVRASRLHIDSAITFGIASLGNGLEWSYDHSGEGGRGPQGEAGPHGDACSGAGSGRLAARSGAWPPA